MSNETVQSNYDALDTIAQRFDRQADLTAATLQRLKQQSEKLRASWEGKGADAFAREMGTVLLPALKRLHQAQLQARATVIAIKQTMAQAESEAAGLFRAAPVSAMMAGGTASNTIAAGMGGGGLANGSGEAAETAQTFFASGAEGGSGGASATPGTFTQPEGGMGGGGLENGSGEAAATRQTEPTITFGARANQGVVSEHTRGVLADILEESNNQSATITSTARTVEDQARIMYGNIERDGVAEQKRLYGPNGDKVIDAFIAAKREGLSEMEIRARMVEKINALGPTNVSKHLADPNVLNVIDVSPNSIANREAFEAAVRADPRVSKFLTPSDGDPAYHIEIPQPQPSESGTN